VVDPGFHLPFDNILSVLSASTRSGCRRDAPEADCTPRAQRYVGSVRRDGDSLVIVPVPVSMNEAILAQVMDARRSAARRQNLETARAAAEDWIAAGPGEGRAHRTLGTNLLKLGRLAEASREVEEAARLLPFDPYSDLPGVRLEIALKQGKGTEAARLADSMRAASAAQPEMVRLSTAIITGPLIGRLAEGEAALLAGLMAQPSGSSLPPAVTGYLTRGSRVVLGIGGDSTVALERALLPLVAPDGICRSRCLALLQSSWVFGLRLTRDKWPGFDSTASRDRRLGPGVARATGDSGALRKAAMVLDNATAEDARLSSPEDGSSLVAADAFLLLGDSAQALRVMRRMTDTTLLFTPLGVPVADAGLAFSGALWPRAYLLRADLEAAVGDKEKAKEFYRKFAELWAGADAEFAAIVQRAKSKQ
jgi:tetratricopeptide (TPR) repeat protein